MGKKRRNLSTKERDKLYRNALGRCEFKGCAKHIHYDHLTQTEGNYSQIAHIYAVNEGGARYDKTLSPKYEIDIDYLMVMCYEHHKIIDENATKYTDQTLIQMKRSHELKVNRFIDIVLSAEPTMVLKFTSRIGDKDIKINDRQIFEATIQNSKIAFNSILDLSIDSADINDHENDYYSICSRNLENNFKTLKLAKEFNTSTHMSLFAIAPMPLLIKLGLLLGDASVIEVYQKQREPDTWSWQDHGANPDTMSLEEGIGKANGIKVAIVIGISADMTDTKPNVLMKDESIDVYRLTVQKPSVNYMQTKELLSHYRNLIRQFLSSVKSKHPNCEEIHVFPAMPVSAAVEFGRVILPKVTPTIVVWDKTNARSGFYKALTLTPLNHDN